MKNSKNSKADINAIDRVVKKYRKEFGAILSGDYKFLGITYMFAQILRLKSIESKVSTDVKRYEHLISTFTPIYKNVKNDSYDSVSLFSQFHIEPTEPDYPWESKGLDIRPEIDSFCNSEAGNLAKVGQESIIEWLFRDYKDKGLEPEGLGYHAGKNEYRVGYYQNRCTKLIARLAGENCKIIDHQPLSSAIALDLSDSQEYVAVNYLEESNPSPSTTVVRQASLLTANDAFFLDTTGLYNEYLFSLLKEKIAAKLEFVKTPKPKSLDQEVNHLKNSLSILDDSSRKIHLSTHRTFKILGTPGITSARPKFKNSEDEVETAWLHWSNIGKLLNNGDQAYIMAHQEYFTAPGVQQLANELMKNNLIQRIVELPIELYNSFSGDQQDYLYLMCLSKASRKEVGPEFITLSDQENLMNENKLQIDEVLSAIDQPKLSWRMDLNHYLAIPKPNSGSHIARVTVFSNLSTHNFPLTENHTTWFSSSFRLQLAKEKGVQPSELLLEASKGRVVRICAKSENDEIKHFTNAHKPIGSIPFYRLNTEFDEPNEEDQKVLALTFDDKESFLATVMADNAFVEFDPRTVIGLNIENVNEVHNSYLVQALSEKPATDYLKRIYKAFGDWSNYGGQEEIHSVNYLLVFGIPLDLPPLDVQRKKVEKLLLKNIQEKEISAAKEKAEADKREIELLSMIRHQHEPIIGDLTTNWNRIYEYMKRKNETGESLTLSDPIHYKLTSTVEQYSKRINANLTDARNLFSTYQRIMVMSGQDLNKSRFNLCKLLETKVSEMSDIPTGVKIVYDGAQELEINTDKQILWQIFENLFRNSFKHAISSEGYLTICIKPRVANGKLLINYLDNGSGFPEGFTGEDYFHPGGRTGANIGSGWGGYIISKCVDRLAGAVTIGKTTELKGKEDLESATTKSTHKGLVASNMYPPKGWDTEDRWIWGDFLLHMIHGDKNGVPGYMDEAGWRLLTETGFRLIIELPDYELVEIE